MKESDNNVKLIVLDRLIGLKDVAAHEKILQVCTFYVQLHVFGVVWLSLVYSYFGEMVLDCVHDFTNDNGLYLGRLYVCLGNLLRYARGNKTTKNVQGISP